MTSERPGSHGPKKTDDRIRDLEAREGRQRSIIRARREFDLEKGHYPDDHPVQRYVQSLADRLKTEGGAPKVQVAPDWREINACAFPDGTIVIAGNLIARAQTEQALLGVIAHEFVHAKKKHMSKQRAKREEAYEQAHDEGYGTALHTYMEALSLDRMHEYEADLRGAVVALDASGQNPIGYKVFLQQLHHRNPEKSLSHGTSRDRALNIAETTFAMHLPSTEQPLTPIPREVVEGIEEDRSQYSYRDVLIRPSLLTKDPAKLQELNERRRQALDRLPDDLVPIALDIVDGKLRFSSEPTTREDVQVLRELVSRFISSIPAEEGMKTKLAPVLLKLGSGMSIEDGMLAIGPKPVKSAKRKAEEQVIEPFVSPEVRAAGSSAWPADPEIQRAFRELIKSRAYPFLGTTYAGIVPAIAAAMKDADLEAKRNVARVWGPLLDESSKAYLSSAWTREWEPDLRSELKIPEEKTGKEKQPSFEEIEEKGVRDWLMKTKGLTDFTKARNVARSLALDFLQTVKQPDLGNISHHLLTNQRSVGEYLSLKLKRDERGMDPVYDQKTSLLATAGFAWLKTVLAQPECARIPVAEKEEALFLYYHANHLADRSRTVSEDDDYIRTIHAYNRRMMQQQPEWAKIASYLDREAGNLDLVEHLDSGRAIRLLRGMKPEFTQGDINWKITPLTHEQEAVIEGDLRTRIAVRQLLTAPGPKDLLKEVGRLEIEAGYKTESQFVKHSVETGPILERLVRLYEKDAFNSLSLAESAQLVSIVPDQALRDAWVKRLLNDRWAKVGFIEKLDTLFPEGHGLGITDFALRERFVDEEVGSREQFFILKKRVEDQLDAILKEGISAAGLGVIVERDFRHTDPREVTETLLALLRSSEDDTKLREQIFQTVSLDPSMNQYDEDVKLAATITQSESVLRTIYTSGPVGRHAILRKMLTSEGGLLPDPARRKIFLEKLFTEWIKPAEGEQDVERVLARIRTAMGDVKEWELLYIAFQGSLGDRIARPPSRRAKSSDWVGFTEGDEVFDPAMARSISALRLVDWKSVPDKALPGMDRYRYAYREYAQRIAYEMLGEATPEKVEAVTPLRFVKDTVQRMSAMGVRFLQNLPLAVEIPEKYAQEFNEIYDQARGQSKISALITMEREWPGIWNEIERFGKRIGGGSIVTVYEVEAKDGEREVIKVLNPNIRHHIEGMHGLAKDIVGSMSRTYGGGYESANVLLDDMKEWIVQDVSFENFLEHDQRFRERHDGYQPEGHRYRLRIPRSRGPENPYFSREQYIPGTNLTQWDALVKKGHDMREVVSTIVKSYIEQIAQGQALSDIHIGNFSITEDNEIAVYDRNFFLHLTSQERQIVSQFINPFASIESKEELLGSFIESGGGVIDDRMRLEIHRLADASSRHDWQEGLRAMTAIKRQGARISLNITLLLKNFHAIQRMAVKSGLGSVMDAYMYTP